MNLSSESLSLSLLSSGDTQRKGVFMGQGASSQTCAYVTKGTQRERYVGGWDTNIYSLIWPEDEGEYREAIPLRDAVSTLDMESFFNLFFPRLVQ